MTSPGTDSSTYPDDALVGRVRLMVGRELGDGFRRMETTRDEVVIKVEALTSRWHAGLTFRIHAGEILGFAGLVGAGRTELAKVLFGEFERTGGTVRMKGREARIKSPADAIASCRAATSRRWSWRAGSPPPRGC